MSDPVCPFAPNLPYVTPEFERVFAHLPVVTDGEGMRSYTADYSVIHYVRAFDEDRPLRSATAPDGTVRIEGKIERALRAHLATVESYGRGPVVAWSGVVRTHGCSAVADIYYGDRS